MYIEPAARVMALYSFGLLCLATSLMVAVVSGTSSFYSRPLASVAGAGSRGAGGSTFNRFYENAAAHSMQVGSCAVSGAHEVCHTADLESDFQVHICPTDGSPCYQNVCYYTFVPVCCPDVLAFADLAECKSVTTLLVEGKTFNVTHYRVPLADNQICVSISPAVEICDETCTLDELCPRVPDACFNNTLTGDISSCNLETCQCKTGYLPPDCCQCDTNNFYLPDCRPFCRGNCSRFRPANVGGCETCRDGFTGEPECCECEPGKTYIDGVCKCDANREPDGTCTEGALEPDCCECDTTGNTTHAFYKNEEDKCIPFCKSNCAVIGSSGCTTCNNGFGPESDCCQCKEGLDEINGECKCRINTFPNGSCIVGAQAQNCCLCVTGYQKNPDTGKCEPEKCDKQQTLYFYIDATDSNTFENFCPLIVVMQMLVAAFNPSSTSGTKINAILFPDIPRSKDSSPVFDSSATCLEAIQGQNGGLRSLLSEFGICLDNNRDYFSAAFPSSCGEGTSAVNGLEKINDTASSGSSSGESALLMLTDGVIEDDSTNLTKVLQNLNSVGVRTLIAAGINGETSMVDRENLRSYTSNDNIVIEDNPIKLGVAIVRKLEEREIICKEHADNITASLENAQGDEITLSNGNKVSTLTLFCSCHRKKYRGRLLCTERTIKYPTCGGDISIGVPLTTTQEAELDTLILEEEILAAVESVLEKFEG